MTNRGHEYYINNPIFVKYRPSFDWLRFKPFQYLKSVHMNERIVELPFAIQSIMSLPKGSRVLDAGCTESPLSIQLATMGYLVTGYDYRPYPYTHPNLDFVQGDLLKLPFDDEMFAAVLCVSTLEHIGVAYYDQVPSDDHSAAQVTEQLRRVLKRQGMLVLSVPYGVPAIKGHNQIYDAKTLQAVLKGFRIAEQRYFISRQKERSRCNYWEEVNEEAASRIVTGESVNGVCLVKALKA
jgi:SAM-dependent methyltransferase